MMRGMKKVRVALLTAFAVFAVSGLYAGTASATPVTIDDAEADIGPLLKNADPLCDAPARMGQTCNKSFTLDVTLTGAPDGNGVAPVVVDDALFNFPVWLTQLSAGGPPTDLNVDVIPTADLTGTYDVSGANAGSLALNAGPFTSQVVIMSGPAAGVTCNSVANQWAFTTENGPPGQIPEPGEMLGQDFGTALPPANGAAVALWDSLQPFVPTPGGAGPQAACDQIALGTSGPGGLWLANGLTVAQRLQAPAPTPNTPTTPPAKKKCKKGQKLKKGKCVKKKKKKKK
jgi:hypothetical protein